jgi:ABC-2 type transport system permease protein
MTGLRAAFRDVVVMTARNLTHIAREPLRLSDVTVQPVLFTLLFIYVLGAGLVLPDHGSYTEFAIAGLLAMNLVTSAIGTAVGLSDDLGTGVIDRFRTLPMWKPAVLVGRSLTDLLTATLCALIVVATGVVIGWRPHAGAGDVIAAFAIFLLFSYALSWGCACIGLFSRDAESSQGLGLVILFPLAIVSPPSTCRQRYARSPTGTRSAPSQPPAGTCSATRTQPQRYTPGPSNTPCWRRSSGRWRSWQCSRR